MYEVVSSSFPTPEIKWQQTLLGRAVVGLMLSQGLYYVLWHLCTFVVLILPFADLAKTWSTTPPEGWVWWVMEIIQGLSLLAGGMLVGASHRRGILLGLALGLVNSIIYVSTQVATYQPMDPESLYGQTAFQIICGGFGGLLGSIIWKPMVPIIGPPPISRSSEANLTRLHGARRMIRLFRGPVAWVRVGAGAILVALASLWTQYILYSMINNPAIPMSVPTALHYQFVTWEFSILFLLIGAAVGGSNTKNGLKQGLLVGVLATCLLLGLKHTEQLREVPQTIILRYFIHIKPLLEYLGISSEEGQVAFMTIIIVVPMGLLGGWFGGQLLPPLLKQARPKRQSTAPA
jgi:putative membrane protein (TIGR04086 family)